jgi:general secretion pathway protein G
MMVVLLIIALIIGSVAVMVQGFEGNAQHRHGQCGKIKALETALTSYKISNLVLSHAGAGAGGPGHTPHRRAAPASLERAGEGRWLVDPWGRKLAYRNPGKHNPGGYDVFSLGPDGVENTEDDIGNW